VSPSTSNAAVRLRRPGVIGFAGILLTALVLLLSANAGSAKAESSGCTGVSGGYTCFYIHGPSGSTLVTSFAQSRGVVGYPEICNYEAHFSADYKGKQYWWGRSAYHQGCFYSSRATRTDNIADAYFMNPTYACGAWYENGSKLGTACNWIKG
jgi:hypothetical protein